MKKEFRQYQLEIHNMSDNGIIEGVASATEVYIEGYHEVVARGAFEKTVKETKGKVSIFKAHNPAIELGTTIDLWEELSGKRQGFNFIGEMLINDNPFHVPEARTEWALMKHKFNLGVKRGISMGFQAMQEGIRKKFAGMRDVRELIEVRVFEISPTPFPANTKAGITQLRNELDIDPEILQRVLNYLNTHGYNIDLDKLISEVSLPFVAAEREPDLLHSINVSLESALKQLIQGVKANE